MESPSAQEDSSSVESRGTVVASPTSFKTEIERTKAGSDAGDARDAAGQADDVEGFVDVASREASSEVSDDASTECQSRDRDTCPRSWKDRDETEDAKVELESNEPVGRSDCCEGASPVKYLNKEEGIAVSSTPVSRKRPASDFLPINAEIKRIGVEIPENEANQLRSDVRRISPVLVSLRERTLGEISLSSDSCIFDDDSSGRCISRNSRIFDGTPSPCRITTNGSLDGCVRISHDPVAPDSEAAHCERATSAGDAVGCRRNFEYSDAYIDEDSCCSLLRDSPDREHPPCQEKQCEEPVEACACDDSESADDACMTGKNSKQSPERVESPSGLTPDRKDKKSSSAKKKQKKNVADDARGADTTTDSEEPTESCFVQRCAQEGTNVQETELEDHSKKQVGSPVATRSTTLPVEEHTVKDCKVMLERVASPCPANTTPMKVLEDEGTCATPVAKLLGVDEEVVRAFSSTSTGNLPLDNLDYQSRLEDSTLSELEPPPKESCSIQRCATNVQKTELEDHSSKQEEPPVTSTPKTPSLEEQSSNATKLCTVMLTRISPTPVRTVPDMSVKDEHPLPASTTVAKNLENDEEDFPATSSLPPTNTPQSDSVDPLDTSGTPEKTEPSTDHDPTKSLLVQRCANENVQMTDPQDHSEKRVDRPNTPVDVHSPSSCAVKECTVMLARVTSPTPVKTVSENDVSDDVVSRAVIKNLEEDGKVFLSSASPSTESLPSNSLDSSKVPLSTPEDTEPSDQKDPPTETGFVKRCTHDVEKTESEDHLKKQSVSPMVTRSKVLPDEAQQSSSGPVKECKVILARVSPKPVKTVVEKLVKDETASRAVIKSLGENEEVVFTSSSPSTENAPPLNNPVSSEAIPGSPELLEPSAEVPEAVDTETETETGSDSSEVSGTNARLRGCDDDAVSDQISCPESESMCCIDIHPEIITRLEAERPEAFTEDSAESLALATGARDEVRSDGSDSGMGSEIPGDPGPAPAPESDSETSFLDRIPDDILSDKEKVVNQLDSFAPTVAAPDTPQTPLATFPSPSKSNLKRRLTDCMEGAPTPKRSNTEESVKKKRNIQFDAVTVYYFPRAQGFTCVPSQGGSTLGMSATHTHAERFSLSEHATEQRRIHRARLAQLRSERAANCVVEAASSSEDPSDDTDEEQSDTEELDIDSYYFLQPVPTWQRRALLRAAGVRRIDAVEKDECRDIRASREHCGCGCKGYCDPESCPCSRANVKCQVDRAGFPCGCTRDGCANSSGRIEFNPVRVRTHFIHTLMRLELEKKQRDEEGTDHDVSDNQNGRSPLREINLGSVMENRNAECLSGGGFTTLHYENHDAADGGTNCQPEIPGTREDSLDLYAIRDDCYPSEDTVDGTQGPQRKLHPEFSQAFQTFSSQTNAGVNFQQPPYQDYQPYANLPSTSRVQFQPQFQAVPGNPGFSHYAPYGQDSGSIQGNCQVHPGQHSSGYEASFAQDETTGSQYTNLNSVQPMNAVQQMGKLEPFSELLSGRYSYYGEMEPQAHGTYHGNGAKVEVEKSQGNEQQSESTEECDENFGEIIKKSMVETVSA
ncbi:uncharacterized protein LOC128878345 [Hylaeus volcanicus]|uniref:uncharacterized protein LOC128878345 n=1 Tax=Hylaeus volcanicus TaxID=313075 RepID=UPI0023B878E7|nr:uncharacterized protein LOC128878345 [Hylaeus volcanicus]